MKTYVINISAPAGTVQSAELQYRPSFNISVTASGPAGPRGVPGDSGITAGSSPPANPEVGQLWLDTSTLN